MVSDILVNLVQLLETSESETICKPRLNYVLMRTLQAFRVFIVGLKNLTVEVDAKYIKGMLNNPDIQPNTMINRWIAAILTFNFKLVHVPEAKHRGTDGLLRKRAAPEDGEEESSG